MIDTGGIDSIKIKKFGGLERNKQETNVSCRIID